jgi:acetylornithine deacetylase/succinyl-diaminopimelate desuccinylase-like protein
MGSIFAIRAGENNNIPPIALGSHLDTQPKGGRYDGILGVNSALEVLRTIHEAGYKTYAPLCVVDWTNEEGARFAPAMIASGVWGGAFDLEYAHQCSDSEGKMIKGELERIGFLGETSCSFKGNPFTAHFECHIEQGSASIEKAHHRANFR